MGPLGKQKRDFWGWGVGGQGLLKCQKMNVGSWLIVQKKLRAYQWMGKKEPRHGCHSKIPRNIELSAQICIHTNITLCWFWYISGLGLLSSILCRSWCAGLAVGVQRYNLRRCRCLDAKISCTGWLAQISCAGWLAQISCADWLAQVWFTICAASGALIQFMFCAHLGAQIFGVAQNNRYKFKCGCAK